MTCWRLSFHGRRAGAIGITHWCETIVEAPDQEAARLKAYESYDHISGMAFTMIEHRLRFDGEFECSFDEFMEANRDCLDENDRLSISWLPVGGSIVFGGGAAAECRIRRVA